MSEMKAWMVTDVEVWAAETADEAHAAYIAQHMDNPDHVAGDLALDLLRPLLDVTPVSADAAVIDDGGDMRCTVAQLLAEANEPCLLFTLDD
jgi:hypothetical protein